MKKKPSFTEKQIAYALKQAELGTTVGEFCRKIGVVEAPFYVWCRKYGGLWPSELKRLPLLEEENRKLKQLVADLSLDKAMLQEVGHKKGLRPAHKRQWVGRLRKRFGVSGRRALRSWRCRDRRFRIRPGARLQCDLLRMREIAQTRIRYGCERVFVMLRREGCRDNHKRVHRIYKEEGLSLRHCDQGAVVAHAVGNRSRWLALLIRCWGMDFVSDALFDGRRFRMLTVVGHFTHDCLDIVIDQSLRGEHVTEAMTRLAAQRSKPAAIKVDNGSEFAGKVMEHWAYENGVGLDFSRRGTPTANAQVEISTAGCGRSV